MVGSQVSAVAGAVPIAVGVGIGQTLGKLLLFLSVRRGQEPSRSSGTGGRRPRAGRSGRSGAGPGRRGPAAGAGRAEALGAADRAAGGGGRAPPALRGGPAGRGHHDAGAAGSPWWCWSDGSPASCCWPSGVGGLQRLDPLTRAPGADYAGPVPKIFSNLNLNGPTPPRVQPVLGEWGPRTCRPPSRSGGCGSGSAWPCSARMLAIFLLGWYVYYVMTGNSASASATTSSSCTAGSRRTALLR